jgi:hypothetical protein
MCLFDYIKAGQARIARPNAFHYGVTVIVTLAVLLSTPLLTVKAMT